MKAVGIITQASIRFIWRRRDFKYNGFHVMYTYILNIYLGMYSVRFVKQRICYVFSFHLIRLWSKYKDNILLFNKQF